MNLDHPQVLLCVVYGDHMRQALFFILLFALSDLLTQSIVKTCQMFVFNVGTKIFPCHYLGL